ncbi:MAG: four-carbon acid sugar kinase family protein [Planctomycetota bacterium]
MDSKLAGTRFSELKTRLPSNNSSEMLSSIREKMARIDRTMIVLDDDPTGTQTVYDVPVISDWKVETLEAEFRNQTPLVFILTNSRSFPSDQACQIGTEVGQAILKASQITGRNFEIVSRSDSTLRGHFPAEVDAVAEAVGGSDLPRILIPFFLEGNRVTIQDTHFVVDNGLMVPASETPFAKDSSFGYQSSNLKDWVEEKTNQQISRDDVFSISIEEIRSSDRRVYEKLTKLPPRSVCIVNCVEISDLQSFVDQLLDASQSGCSFIYRTAASFVQVRAGLGSRPLLTREEIVGNRKGAGVIVVGSYVPKTTRQLTYLREHKSELEVIELDVPRLLDDDLYKSEVEAGIKKLNAAVQNNRDALVFTSREFVGSGSAKSDLANGKKVSDVLVRIVQSIQTEPAFVIAKGGITSSDVATKALGFKRAQVLGQILPGVPCWQMDGSSKYPGLGYVVFPGNVGDDSALLDAYQKLKS